MKIEIKSRWNATVLFSLETGSVKLCVEAAVKSRANLSGANLSRANLWGADLSGAYLSQANLSRANLWGADLSGADLSEAYLSGAYLSRANLWGADLSGANLSGADLSGADLSEAYLSGAYLSRANLSGADLSRANLWGAKDADFVIASTRILPDGDLIGWKKCRDGIIVKILIPTDAKRSNAFGRECRAEFVRVLEIIGAEEAVSQREGKVIYRVGEIVCCDKWDEDFQKDRSGGIHFFITRFEAENY